MIPKILVAGIGNIFLGDDGFGVEVAQRLSTHKLPDNVHVVDFGIRVFDLVYALQDGYQLTILVDAVPRGESPGTLFVIEPEFSETEIAGTQFVVQTHGMDPLNVMRLAKAMGGPLKRILIVGCEPQLPESMDEDQVGLSEAVTAAIDPAIELVLSLIREFFGRLETRYA